MASSTPSGNQTPTSPSLRKHEITTTPLTRRDLNVDPEEDASGLYSTPDAPEITRVTFREQVTVLEEQDWGNGFEPVLPVTTPIVLAQTLSALTTNITEEALHELEQSQVFSPGHLSILSRIKDLLDAEMPHLPELNTHHPLPHEVFTESRIQSGDLSDLGAAANPQGQPTGARSKENKDFTSDSGIENDFTVNKTQPELKSFFQKLTSGSLQRK